MTLMQEDFLPFVLKGLAQLTADEQARLHALLNEDVAYLLTKAFGPKMGALVWPALMKT